MNQENSFSRMDQEFNMFAVYVVCILWNDGREKSGTGAYKNLDNIGMERNSSLATRHAATST